MADQEKGVKSQVIPFEDLVGVNDASIEQNPKPEEMMEVKGEGPEHKNIDSKNLYENIDKLPSDKDGENLLNKFKAKKTHIVVKNKDGVLERQYLKLKDGAEKIGDNFNEKSELVFEVFDVDGNRVLNEDGSNKEIKKESGKIKYQVWKTIEPIYDAPKSVVFKTSDMKLVECVLTSSIYNGYAEYFFKSIDGGMLRLEEGQVIGHVGLNGEMIYSANIKPRAELADEKKHNGVEKSKSGVESKKNSKIVNKNLPELVVGSAEFQMARRIWLESLPEFKALSDDEREEMINSNNYYEEYRQFIESTKWQVANLKKDISPRNLLESEIRDERRNKAKEIWLKGVPESKKKKMINDDYDFRIYLEEINKKFGVSNTTAIDMISDGIRIDKAKEDSNLQRVLNGVKKGSGLAFAGAFAGGFLGSFGGPIGTIFGAPIGASYGILRGVNEFSNERITVPITGDKPMVFESEEDFQDWVKYGEYNTQKDINEEIKDKLNPKAKLVAAEIEPEEKPTGKPKTEKIVPEKLKLPELKKKCEELIVEGIDLLTKNIDKYEKEGNQEAVDYFTVSLEKLNNRNEKIKKGEKTLKAETLEIAISTISGDIEKYKTIIDQYDKEAAFNKLSDLEKQEFLDLKEECLELINKGISLVNENMKVSKEDDDQKAVNWYLKVLDTLKKNKEKTQNAMEVGILRDHLSASKIGLENVRKGIRQFNGFVP